MRLLPLTLLFSLLNFTVDFPASDSRSSATTVEPMKAPEAANIVLQSKDGGKTWQDISQGLPEITQPEGFFAGDSEIYLNIKGVMYRSKSNLNTPVWEKEDGIDQRSTIAFKGAEVLAYSFSGNIYQKKAAGTWMPIYTSLKSTKLERHDVATIFEAADGTVFRSTGKSFSKSTDKGRSWKLIQKIGVGEIVEADGVLLATGQKGIMRSTDKGENWEWVISEGGVGIDLEYINGGFAAIAYNTTTKSRRIHTSLDGGKTWQVISEGLQPSANISSVKQIGNHLFVGHPEGIFRSSDMVKTWLRVHAGFGSANPIASLISWNTTPAPVEKVFKLHVSGNVLYAVAVAPGC